MSTPSPLLRMIELDGVRDEIERMKMKSIHGVFWILLNILIDYETPLQDVMKVMDGLEKTFPESRRFWNNNKEVQVFVGGKEVFRFKNGTMSVNEDAEA